MEHNIRPSLQRIAVVEYMLTHHTHPSADERYNALSAEIPTLSLTTMRWQNAKRWAYRSNSPRHKIEGGITIGSMPWRP